MHPFYPFWVSGPHGDGVFSHQKRSFLKTLSIVDLFEKAVFLFSCGRVKTELFENADITVSIYNPSEHAFGSLGITRGHFVYVFSDFKYHSVFVWTAIILKTLLVWMQIYCTRTKKMHFQNNLHTC